MTTKQPYMAVQNLVQLRQVPQAMAIVLTVQTFGSSVWLIVANVIFNNNLRKLLSKNASVIGLAPGFVIILSRAPAARTAWASRGLRYGRC